MRGDVSLWVGYGDKRSGLERYGGSILHVEDDQYNTTLHILIVLLFYLA